MKSNLKSFQELFWASLVQPSGEFNKEYFQDINSEIKSIIIGDENFSSSQRFEIYHRQFWYRIIDSLTEDFNLLIDYIGKEKFIILAEKYLIEYPSDSYSLRHLGKSFAKWISETDINDVITNKFDKEKLTYLAQVDYAEMQAFEAKQYNILEIKDIDKAEIILQPHVRLVSPLNEVEVKEKWFKNLFKNKFYIVWRDKDNTIHKSTEKIEYYNLLKSIEKGGSLEKIISRVEDLPQVTEIQTSFQKWQERGWLATVI